MSILNEELEERYPIEERRLHHAHTGAVGVAVASSIQGWCDPRL